MWEGPARQCENLDVPAVSTTSPGYDLVLLAHVLAAVVGLVALGVAAGSALALRRVLDRGGPVPEALARYYRPGVNWAGRVLFLVPVFGVALLLMSGGQWNLSDTWVSLGLAGWALVALVAEGTLWPEERRLQSVVATVVAGAGSPEEGGTGADDPAPDGVGPVDLSVAPGRCMRVGLVGLGLGALLVAVGVLMVAKP